MEKYYRQAVIYADDFGSEWQDVYVCKTKEELKKAIYEGTPHGYYLAYEREVEEVEEIDGFDSFLRFLNDKDKMELKQAS